MRLYDKTMILLPEDRLNHVSDHLVNQTVPIRLRCRQPASHRNSSSDISNGARKSLRVVTKRMILTPKATILSRIVVVGEGTCALSVVEQLSMAGDCYLPNVTLVTPNPSGDPLYQQSVSLERTMVCTDHDAPAQGELTARGIDSFLSIHIGRVSMINRNEMTVTIGTDFTVAYDKLVLAPTAQDATYKRLHALGSRLPYSFEAIGIFFLGHEATGIKASQWLEQQREHVRTVSLNTARQNLCSYQLGNVKTLAGGRIWGLAHCIVCDIDSVKARDKRS